MSKGKILVTDSLFIFDEHIVSLEAAGYEVERLDLPNASEQEVCEAIKDKVGYILGGTEFVTEKVLGCANNLKAISVCGIDYKHFVPAWKFATEKSVAISNAPDGPTLAVAEWSIAAALSMNRGFFELGSFGKKDFLTTSGLEGQRVGIVGLGRIGRKISEMLEVFRPAKISYYSKSPKNSNLEYQDLKTLLETSDVVFICVSGEAGNNFISTKELSYLSDNALIVSFMHPGIIDEGALLKELKNGRVRAISDYPMTSTEFKSLPVSNWFSFNGSNAFNTKSETMLVSNTVTNSLLNLLKNGEDRYKVN